MSHTISVAAPATRVNTSEARLGRTAGNREILNLPLVNPDVYALLTLTSGVDHVASDNPLTSPTETVTVNGSSTGPFSQLPPRWRQ